MLSQATWNALSANGRKEYEPLLGKTFRHIPTGFVGEATDYTLLGQLWLWDGDTHKTCWADECEEVKA